MLGECVPGPLAEQVMMMMMIVMIVMMMMMMMMAVTQLAGARAGGGGGAHQVLQKAAQTQVCCYGILYPYHEYSFYRQFFLFNDILVYGSIIINKKKYTTQHIIPLEVRTWRFVSVSSLNCHNLLIYRQQIYERAEHRTE